MKLKYIIAASFVLAHIQCHVMLSSVEALFTAIEEGNQEEIEEQIQAGVDVNAPATRRELGSITALMYAAKQNKIDIVRTLLAYGANPNIITQEGYTALGYACTSRSLDIIQVLLRSGANPDIRQEGGWTPLMSVAHFSHQGTDEILIAQALIQAGADVNAVDQFQRTALEAAIYQEALDMIDLLLSSGAHCNVRNHRDQTVLQVAFHCFHRTKNTRFIKIALKLLTYGAIYSPEDQIWVERDVLREQKYRIIRAELVRMYEEHAGRAESDYIFK